MQLYRYLTGVDDAAFCLRVTTALNLGWQLYGAPTMTFNGTNVIVGQVVTKEIEGDYNPAEHDLAELLKVHGQGPQR
jgi:hypothetical protein